LWVTERHNSKDDHQILSHRHHVKKHALDHAHCAIIAIHTAAGYYRLSTLTVRIRTAALSGFLLALST
jgi:hypothetical protein